MSDDIVWKLYDELPFRVEFTCGFGHVVGFLQLVDDFAFDCYLKSC